ncbi:ATP-dependent DNA helicase [Candidatus Woesearchaeota archaeon]|nr:ATP-dependent DNA helicase [Candidatus Woesearchaeota archaeon]
MTDFFPYSQIRAIQQDFINDVKGALEHKRHLIVHAPTGLGKTAATLAPALEYCFKHNKTIFFLTSRHTQHLIAIKTLTDIKQRTGCEISAVDLIGKKWMCSYPGVDVLHSSEFSEFCKKQREESACEYYVKTKQGQKLTVEAQAALSELRSQSPCHVERLRKVCSNRGLCTYEMATALAGSAQVIVADYYYIFNHSVRDALFKRAQLKLEDCIVIVDEGHNLPGRTRSLLTHALSTFNIRRSISEAKKAGRQDILDSVLIIQDALNELSQDLHEGEQKLVDKDEFIAKIVKKKNYQTLIDELEEASHWKGPGSEPSSLLSMARFLKNWEGDDAGFVRFMSRKALRRESMITLTYCCLDPSLLTKDIIEQTYCTIMMSGTLTPTAMYRDILGFPDDTVEKTYPNSFPEKNKLTLIIPKTTTRFAERNPEQFQSIAQICAEIGNAVPGNCVFFFPSYYVRNEVNRFFSPLCRKTTFVEDPDMTKEEKSEFLERFKSYERVGAVLLGVVSGSYGEGIDLPGNLLNCVVIVGLPLLQPTLDTKKLIEYYDQKFSKGWEYGYVGPAFSKCIQSAGRCIRSEYDRGVIIFLDERYTWNNYIKYFPADWNLKVTLLYLDRIREFYELSAR